MRKEFISTVNQFRKVAEENGSKKAIILDDESITYSDLLGRVEAFSCVLVEEGNVAVQDHVVLCMDRSIECIVALLGILNVGCVYIPIDPANSKQRINHILNDADPKVVVTNSKLMTEVDFSSREKLVFDEVDWSKFTGKSTRANVTPDFVMYILYTSGTTGLPKGVAVNHLGAENLLSEVKEVWPLDKNVLQFASLGFDASVPEWAGTLTMGGTLIMTRKRELKLGNELIHFIREHSINYIKMPAAVLGSLNHLEELPSVETVVTAGDACNEDLVNKWAVGRTFYNCYGPTENSIGSTRSQCYPGQPVDIGVPVKGISAYILDEDLNPVPDGEVGEIYLGGIQVSYGYINKPAMTAEKFLPDPFEGKGQRMYKSGDLGRLLPNGAIDFVGRVDNQIKLNGYRIEIDEIDTALAKTNVFTQSATVAIFEEKEQFLLVFYSSDETPDWVGLKEQLNDDLPAYMIPQRYEEIASFPLTVNGKIDRKKLEEMYKSSKEVEVVDPAPNMEEETVEGVLLAIWKKALKVENINPKDSFFDLGAGSLDAAILIAEVEAKYGISPSIADLYEQPVFEDFKELTEKFVKAFA